MCRVSAGTGLAPQGLGSQKHFNVHLFTPRFAWPTKLRLSLIAKEHPNMKPKNTICLWFDKDAQEAARFYASTFPDSKVTAVRTAPGDYPGGRRATY